MMVGENVPFRTHDYAGTKARGAPALRFEPITEKAPEHRIFHQGVGRYLDFFARKDVYHRRHGFLRCNTEAAGSGDTLRYRRGSDCFLYRDHGPATCR